jgi:hypothetical protein
MDPRQRLIFERMNLASCTEIEERVMSESAFDCAYESWIVKGPIGGTVRFGSNIYDKIANYATNICVFVVVVSLALVYQYQKQQKVADQTAILAYNMGALQTQQQLAASYQQLSQQSPRQQLTTKNQSTRMTVQEEVDDDDLD